MVMAGVPGVADVMREWLGASSKSGLAGACAVLVKLLQCGLRIANFGFGRGATVDGWLGTCPRPKKRTRDEPKRVLL
jgi:hypothetical protein